MGFYSGAGTAGQTAVSLMSPKAASAIVLYNQGPSPVTVGGPGVTFGAGVILTALALPLAIQATHFGNVEDADDSIWVVSSNAATANAVVGWIHGF
jgi:hypothetical protein